MANTFFLSTKGFFFFLVSSYIRLLFAAQRKISYSNHMKNFFIQYFFHCLCCLYIVVYTFCVEIKQTGAVFSRLLLRFLDRKSGVLCTIFRQFHSALLLLVGRKISFKWIMDCGQFFLLLHHLSLNRPALFWFVCQSMMFNKVKLWLIW